MLPHIMILKNKRMMSMLVIPHRETLNIKCNNKGQQALVLTFPTESYGKKLSTKMKEKKTMLILLIVAKPFVFLLNLTT